MMVRAGGFSLLELVIATALTTAVLAGVFAMLHPARGAFQTAVEIADLQQRLRVAVDTLTRDLAMAGSGAYAAGRIGPLIYTFAPVLPFRQGQSGADPPGTFRPDVLTLISVPSTAAQTTLAVDLMPAALTVQTTAAPGCPAGSNLCRFAAGMTVIVYDETGNVGAFTIAAVDDAAAQLTFTARSANTAGTTYKRGSTVIEASLHVYYLKTDLATQTFQLMHYDGTANADVPVVDHIVGLTFEFHGDPVPPTLTAAGDATYGPAPPPIGAQTTAYPAGENCVFLIDPSNGGRVPRLPSLAAASALAPLTAAQLVDGPWCPDAINANRWDADLLRVRRVAVTIRVEAALSALRGPAGVLFSNAGTSREPTRWAPDQEIHFQVSPRNMSLTRK
jgi:Tfp pilus assembly protein PilW